MDSKNDDTHTAADEAHDDAAQSQFLAALLAASQEGAISEADREPVAEDGMALSSSLDDIELPGVSQDSGNPRSESSASFKKTEIMYSIEKNSKPNDDEPVEDQIEESISTAEDSVEAESDLLLLACPKCDGQLALREEHIGVEGACVWCKAPIVAGRSGADRAVKVFAIASDEEPKAEPPKMEEMETPSAPVEEPTSVAVVEAPPAAVDDPILSGWGASSPTAETTPAEDHFPAADYHIPTEETPASEESVKEEFAPSAGFGVPVDATPASEPEETAFGEFSAEALPSVEETPSDQSYSGSGFGEFLSSASGTVDEAPPQVPPESETIPASEQAPADDFSSPTPWGPPSMTAAAETQLAPEPAPAGFASPEKEAEPSPAFSTLEPEAAPETAPSGFLSPENEVEPAPEFSPVETEFTPEPAPMAWGAPDASTVSAEAEPNAAPSPVSEDNTSLFDTPAPGDDAPAAVSDVQPDNAPASVPDTEALFSQSAPQQEVTKNVSEDIPVGFNIPSNESPGSPFQALAQTDEAPATVNVPADTSLLDLEAKKDELPAPSFEEPASKPSLFGTPNSSSSSLFGQTPEAAPTPAAETPANPFGSEEPSSEPEVKAEIETPAQAPTTPQVESVTLGKKKKRKGFFIIAVIVLGLVCGAALASFVLPVDDYVNSARSLMEKKFMPSASWESAQTSPPPAQPTAPPVKVEN